MKNIRVSAVSYLNTRPFTYGLEKQPVDGLSLSLDMPSECARKLLEGEADIGLVPVAVLPLLKQYEIISDYCIGAVGAVKSVKLYSQVPPEQIETVLLDYQSRTSVTLVRVLAAELWKISPQWKPAAAGFEQQVSGTTAAVVIGDRTFALNGTFAYEYDLAEGWMQLTGLPFVFAAWVSTVPLSAAFLESFNSALRFGVTHIPAMLSENPQVAAIPGAAAYLTESIRYELDAEKRKGLELFLEKMKSL